MGAAAIIVGVIVGIIIIIIIVVLVVRGSCKSSNGSLDHSGSGSIGGISDSSASHFEGQNDIVNTFTTTKPPLGDIIIIT